LIWPRLQNVIEKDASRSQGEAGRSLMEEKAYASPSNCPLVDTLRGREVLQIGELAVLDGREVLLASAMGRVPGWPGYGVLANF